MTDTVRMPVNCSGGFSKDFSLPHAVLYVVSEAVRPILGLWKTT